MWLLLDVVDVVWCLLVDIVVYPVGIEQVGMGAPCDVWRVVGIVAAVIVHRNGDRQPGVLVPQILFFKSPRNSRSRVSGAYSM